ncbi:hypothetical protein RI129_009634 [Pyrocoelia pectoralis]|uniref:Major facilitator superfamily (MFS) profile domain-containing protein n=1 Tax=Pyrocoelia pectoralis TaxID=417401 RepID=A0AAN7ZF34_9COLE
MQLDWLTLSNRYMQYVSVISVSLAASSITAYIAWSSPALPQLTFLSQSESSWIASVDLFGAIPGGILGGCLMDKIGRKWSIFIATVLFFLPWIPIGVSNNGSVLIVARFVAGIGIGLTTTVVPIYVSEIVDKDIRGRLTTIYVLFSLLGTITMLSVGPFISYKNLSFIGAAFPIACALTFFFLPESPHFLLRIKNKDAARTNLTRLSSKFEDREMIESRLEELEKIVENSISEKFTLKDLICNKDHRRPILILIGLKTIHQLCGLTVINAYMQTIMNLSHTHLPSYVSSIIYGVIQFPSAILSAVLVDKLGRKPLLAISTFGCGTALVCEGIYFYLHNSTTVDLSKLYWFPTFALTLFIVMIPIGISTLSYLMLGELFTMNAKRVAGIIFTTYNGSLLAFVTVRSFAPLVQSIGIHAVFWIFAGVCYLGTIFSIFVLPETKGKSLQEIQDLLSKRNTC